MAMSCTGLKNDDAEFKNDAAMSMWLEASGRLGAAGAERAWQQLLAASPADHIWHSLRNCVAYQVAVWSNVEHEGAVCQPAAFKLALVLRHSHSDLALSLLEQMLHQHPHYQDLTSYIISLITEAEVCGAPPSPLEGPPAPAPPRDLQLFADCELAALAANSDIYDLQARLVRAEYPHMTDQQYTQLRVKILEQFSKIPKLFLTAEFEPLEVRARHNIQREITALKGNTALQSLYITN